MSVAGFCQDDADSPKVKRSHWSWSVLELVVCQSVRASSRSGAAGEGGGVCGRVSLDRDRSLVREEVVVAEGCRCERAGDWRGYVGAIERKSVVCGGKFAVGSMR